MQEIRVRGVKKWASFYRQGSGNVYPDENLVRLIRGRYMEIPRSGRVLDVGFGRGANLVMLAQSGFEAHGLEVSEESIEAARELASLTGCRFHLGLLTGTNIPYPDHAFDIIVSWNAVYYYGKRSLVAEYQRVLDRGDLEGARQSLADLRALDPFDPEFETEERQLMDAINAEWRRRRELFREQLAGEVEELVEAGRAAFREEQLDPALDLWRRALLIDPENERVQAYIARAERQLENLERLRNTAAGENER